MNIYQRISRQLRALREKISEAVRRGETSDGTLARQATCPKRKSHGEKGKERSQASEAMKGEDGGDES